MSSTNSKPARKERHSGLRPNVELDAYVVMPDHMHAILPITHRDEGAAATQASSTLRSPARTIGAIVRGFKGAVVRRVGQPVWQSNYYEHIIRSEAALDRIRRYINYTGSSSASFSSPALVVK